MKNKGFFTLCVFFLIIFNAQSCFPKDSKINTNDFLGVWEIYNVINYYGHDSKAYKLAKKSIGKDVEIQKKYFKSKDDVPFQVKGVYENVSYSIKTRRYHIVKGKIVNDDYVEGSLAGYGLPGAYEDKSVYFIIKTETGEITLEVSKKGELVYSGEKVFVFLRKVK